ncbi:MAG: hypothetical protein NZM00_09020 [Anaerolinea sp.]|nr:hypothetical protein [Anaerolinea sp.]
MRIAHAIIALIDERQAEDFVNWHIPITSVQTKTIPPHVAAPRRRD